MLMKEAQTVRCVLCHLADPVVPRPRSARCTVASAVSPSRSVRLRVSFPPPFLPGVTKFCRVRSRHPLSVGWRKKEGPTGTGARRNVFFFSFSFSFLVRETSNSICSHVAVTSELGQKRWKFDSFLIPVVYHRRECNGYIFISFVKEHLLSSIKIKNL